MQAAVVLWSCGGARVSGLAVRVECGEDVDDGECNADDGAPEYEFMFDEGGGECSGYEDNESPIGGGGFFPGGHGWSWAKGLTGWDIKDASR